MLKNLARLFRYRVLIASLVQRELKARYRGSLLGYFWSFLNPLMQLAVYTIVFSTFMRGGGQMPGVPQETYALFLFCGILPWTWFSSALMESSDTVIANGNLIRKLLFPTEVLPLVSVLANMVHFLLGLPILFIAFFVYRGLHLFHAMSWWMLLLPVVVLLQLLITCGFSFGLSALSVHFRDLRNIMGNVLMMGFFSSAIIQPYSMFESYRTFRWVLKLNPVAHLMVAYQHVLYFGYPLGLRPFLLTAAFAFVTFFTGYFIFDRLRDSFVDEV